ncbi:MAG: hypothetical protein AAFQ87_10830 [Bacteroidota bacterium]
MDLEQFKSAWQATEERSAKQVSINELNQIMKMKTQKSMGRMRLRLIIEAVLLTLFLFLFYNGFDGYNKPWALNVLLGLAVGGTVIHKLYALRFIHLGLQGESLKESLRFLSQRFRQQGGVSALLLVGYNVAWLLYASVNVELTQYLALALVVVLIVILTVAFFTWRSWNKRAQEMEGHLTELEG